MMKDIHPELGPRMRVSSIEEALARVRDAWPRVGMEGSTGFQRSFWVDGELVAHCWEIRGREDDFWLRIKTEDVDPPKPGARQER